MKIEYLNSEIRIKAETYIEKAYIESLMANHAKIEFHEGLLAQHDEMPEIRITSG